MARAPALPSPPDRLASARSDVALALCQNRTLATPPRSNPHTGGGAAGDTALPTGDIGHRGIVLSVGGGSAPPLSRPDRPGGGRIGPPPGMAMVVPRWPPERDRRPHDSTRTDLLARRLLGCGRVGDREPRMASMLMNLAQDRQNRCVASWATLQLFSGNTGSNHAKAATSPTTRGPRWME